MSILKTTKNLATVPLNLVGGLFGNPFDPKGGHQAITTQSQRDYLDNLVNQQGGTSGVLSYDDYGTKFNLSDLKNPTAFSTAMTMGGTGWNKSDTGNITYTGGKYDFDGAVPFIDKGGLMGISHDLGGNIYDFLNPEDDPYAGIEGQTAMLDPFSLLTLGSKILGPTYALKTGGINELAKYKIRKDITDKGWAKTKEILAAKAAAEAAAKAKADAAAAAAAEQNRLAQSRRVIHDPGSGGGGGGGTWHRQTAAKEKAGQKVAGPGFGKGAYFRDGGLINFYRYGGFV
tara:strand:+ start:43 stop:903 length:861 start_codon:yes stop_codon:yes gene_type:complete